MALIGRNIFIGSDEEIFIGTDGYDKTTQPTFVGIATPFDGGYGDQFGTSVAVGSDKIVVGSPSNDNPNNQEGKVYIYNFDGNLVGVITASDGVASGFFGASVAVGNDKIVVGSRLDDPNGIQNSYSAFYIYDLDGNNEVIITNSGDGATNDAFADDLAIGYGKIVVCSRLDDTAGSNNGSIYIYDMDGTNKVKVLFPETGVSDALFGSSVAVGSGRIVVGAPTVSSIRHGSVYVFDLFGNLLKKITASDGAAADRFGSSVAVGSGRIVVGASGAGIPRAGAVYIYDLEGNEVRIITGSNPVPSSSINVFGHSVAVGSGRIVVGDYYDGEVASQAGKSYVYDLDGNEVGIITASDGAFYDRFGRVVVAENGKIIITAYNKEVNGTSLMGGIYIYNTPNFDHIFDILDK